MSVFFEQSQIDQWISEDASCLDLTSHMLGLTEQAAMLRFVVRNEATLAGGAMPHRLGLGETILVFPQHRALLGGWDEVGQAVARHKHAMCEKKIVIEADGLDEARRAIEAGADVVQFDKVPPETLARIVPELRAAHPGVPLLAAGGIHAGNAAAYAATGVNALVTSSLHYAKPADIGVKIELADGRGEQTLPATGVPTTGMPATGMPATGTNGFR